MTVDNIVQRQL